MSMLYLLFRLNKLLEVVKIFFFWLYWVLQTFFDSFLDSESYHKIILHSRFFFTGIQFYNFNRVFLQTRAFLLHCLPPVNVHMLPCSPITSSPCLFLPPRIPEGQAEAGSLAAGRLRSLEDQLTIAKQKIHSFQKLTGDGKQVGAIWNVSGERIWHRARKYEKIDSGGV